MKHVKETFYLPADLAKKVRATADKSKRSYSNMYLLLVELGLQNYAKQNTKK